MLPVAGIISLADTALQTWNRISEAHAPQKPGADFQAILNKLSAANAVNGAVRSSNTCPASLQSQLATLPEVGNVLRGAAPGSRLIFSISAEGQLSQVLPNGSLAPVALSADSQRLVNLWANSGGESQVVAMQTQPEISGVSSLPR
jgi:hypothetical protein